ncbi:MAG: hypothetical protein E6J61_08835 [Deltaproteobacteria bacterium]|nr:MAG: hypothetical protein E6J61_08835 [Deltaproteobacteria bacterium]
MTCWKRAGSKTWPKTITRSGAASRSSSCAATPRPEERYVLRGSRLLGKLWKPKLSRVWPGPVAGYLLGKVEETAFLEDGYEDPDLEARRLASARFWAGVKAQDPELAKAHFEASAAIEGASALEVEHHLARGEIGR